MTRYWDLTKEQLNELREKGIDYDLEACLEENPQSFDVLDIDKVLAVREGENDGEDWHWILKLKDKRYCYLTGGCDYTGWDCQSSATSEFAKTAKMAANFVADDKEVYDFLMKQLKEKKSETWREKKDKEFGL